MNLEFFTLDFKQYIPRKRRKNLTEERKNPGKKKKKNILGKIIFNR